MKYTEEIIVRVSREEFIEKFSEPENFKHWQKGFIFMKPLNGEMGAEGSQNLLKYDMGKRKIEMTETILKNDLPSTFISTYEADGVYNYQKNTFEIIDENSTKWTAFNEFKFSGFMKAIGFLMPGAFKKQSRQYMEDFKSFAEDGKSVLDEE